MKISAISISDKKGIRKKNIDSVALVENHGLDKDAHAGKWHRQVSFLAQESIDTMREKGLDVVAGNFAENITTTGIDLSGLAVGSHIKLGNTELIISQLGKVCHHKCAIYYEAGDCVMPREGIFAVVIKGGEISVGDTIEILPRISSSAGIIGTKNVEETKGALLKKAADHLWSPAFTRFDRLNNKENNLDEILKDLVTYQKLNNIVLCDPEQKHALSLISHKSIVPGKIFKADDTFIYLCEDEKELELIGKTNT